MQIRIPDQGKFYQPNKGEKSGNLYRTTNIDLKTNPGMLRLSPRLTINTKDTDLGVTGLGTVVAFETYTENSTPQFWAACGIGTGSGTAGSGQMLVSASTSLGSAFINDTTSGFPTAIHSDYSDMVLWRKGLYVGTYSGSTNKIARLVSATWTADYFNGVTGSSFVNSGSCKNMCVGFNNNLYICDDYRVIYVTTADSAVVSGTGTVTSTNTYRPIWIRSSSNRLWIGLMTMDANAGAVGYVAEWDTTGTAFNRIIKVDAPCALSCVIKDDIPWIIDAYGRLKKLVGNYSFEEVARLPVANLNIEMPGIYNDLTNNRWIHHRGMSVVDGKININLNNFVSTGNYVKEMPSGVWELDDTDPQNQFLYHKNAPCTASTDWGQQAIASAGALYGVKKSTGNVLAGISYYTDNAVTQRYGIFYDEVAVNTNKRGIIETPFLMSQKIEDTFQDLTFRFRPLTSGDHIKPKYRSAKDAHLPFIASITWISSTAFTSTDSNFQYVLADHEVEIVMGTGGSTTSRISSVNPSDVGYTVILNEAIGPSSGSGKAIVTNYKESIDISATDTSSESTTLGEVNTKIQMKVEFRGTGDFEIDDMTLGSKAHQ